MEDLKKSLLFADENFLVGLSNKGTYKRACKDTDGAEADFDLGENSATVRTGGETCTISVPLAESKCTCVARGICRHIVGAILILRNNVSLDVTAESPVQPETPVEKPEPVAEVKEEKKKEQISERDIEKIHNCVKQCLETLGSILKYGLVRIPENLPDMLEASAVRCHSLKMADAERALRETGSRLSDCIARRASFSMESFTAKLCRCIAVLELLEPDFIEPEQLGTFRQTYTDYKGYLNILPIGQRSVKGSEYEGEIYYFLNTDVYAEQRFLSLSDLRPVFYNDTQRHFRGVTFPWGMASSMSSMMHSEMKLAHAKVSGGKLSSSQETQIISSCKAVLDCYEIRDMIYTDFRKLAIETSEKNPENELEKLCFVQPEKCIESTFDKYSQQYVIILEDVQGNRISVRAKYRAETKEFIKLLESIGERMIKKPKKNYVFLASAYIFDGELTLFPIEIYDFIKPPAPEVYELPEKYRDIDVSAVYAERIISLFSEINDRMCVIVRGGLQADIKNDHKLENLAFNYGLKGLSRLIGEFMQCASSYRHSVDGSSTDVLLKMREIDEYIRQGRKRLEIITSLYNMKGSK